MSAHGALRPFPLVAGTVAIGGKADIVRINALAAEFFVQYQTSLARSAS